VSSIGEAETGEVEDWRCRGNERGEMEEVGRVRCEDGVAATARAGDDSSVDNVAGPGAAAEFASSTRKRLVEWLRGTRGSQPSNQGVSRSSPGLREDDGRNG